MKTLKLLLSLTLLPLLAMGQANPLNAVSIKAGLKVGANLTSLNGQQWSDGYKANFLGGVVGSVRFLKFGVQAEALFVQNSYQSGTGIGKLPGMFYNNIADSAKQGNFRVSQLSVPVLVMLRLPGGVWLQAGPQYNHVLTVNEKKDLIKDPEKLFKSNDISGVVGLELIAAKHFAVGARYVFGFSDINNIEGAKDAWKSRAIQLHVGYLF